MRYLLLADIHANIKALTRVLEHALDQAWDEVVFLGDAVGYGEHPEAVVQTLISLKPYVAVKGNHEAMVLDAAAGERNNIPNAMKHMVLRQIAALSDDSLAFLAGLEARRLEPCWGAVHGALRRPWEYLISIPVARANQPFMERPLYFVGHTHIPAVFSCEAGRWRTQTFRSEAARFSLKAESAVFFNPGSVGEPRDGLDAPSYAIFDETEARLEVFRLFGRVA